MKYAWRKLSCFGKSEYLLSPLFNSSLTHVGCDVLTIRNQKMQMNPSQSDIRIVIPAYNANRTIVDCIEAILKAISFCKSSEIIVVDNSQNNDLLKLLDNYPIRVLKRNETSSAAYAVTRGRKVMIKGSWYLLTVM